MADRTSRQAPPPGAPRRQVRRNLFQGLTRRPTGPMGASVASTMSTGGAGGIVSAAVTVAGSSGNGMAGAGSSSGAAATDDREESNKERQRLAEAVKQHQVNHTAIREQPEELLEAVRASLRAKVAALAEDNWMYEAEPELPRAF
ncbi:hypothetical protein LY78DRAFT_146817 [Colletotrichum sublineola]|nr:hypothetical protein LY78DRAFT_146817 [Colletotrichum sublineola]